MKNMKITFESGEFAGMEVIVPKQGELTVGRDPQECQVVCSDTYISRKHCSISYNSEKKEVVLKNYSRNGTTVERRRKKTDGSWFTDKRILNTVGTKMKLESGDRVGIGKHGDFFVVTYEQDDEKKEDRSKMALAMAVCMCVLLFAVVLVCGKAFRKENKNEMPDTENNTEITTSEGHTDNDGGADDTETSTESAEYYDEISEKVIQNYAVSESENVETESEAIKTLKDRGFEDYEVTSDVSMNGEVIDEITASSDSDTKHPSYMTYYSTGNGDVWVIYIIDGMVLANPFFYNAELEEGSIVMFSEKNSVISYDFYTNSFFEIIPKDSEMNLKTVNRIDSSTLDTYTADVIKGME